MVVGNYGWVRMPFAWGGVVFNRGENHVGNDVPCDAVGGGGVVFVVSALWWGNWGRDSDLYRAEGAGAVGPLKLCRIRRNPTEMRSGFVVFTLFLPLKSLRFW